jgi:pimeloyl-ACP methyl ester carboxylesterase
MAKLFGAQRMVLQAVNDLPKNAAGFVTDDQIIQATQISESDVRDWLDTLDGEGLIEVARTTKGLSVLLTAKGRLQLGLYQPIPTSHGDVAGAASSASEQPPVTESSATATAGSGSPPITASPSPPGLSPSTSASSEPGTAPPAAEDFDGFQVVLLIHGIRTMADWGPMVRSKLEVPGQIEVIPIKYGYFDALRFWFPFWTRNKPIERVYTQIRVALQRHRRNHPDAKLSIVAHSFGTYVVGEILKRGFDLQIHRLILCGSVLPQDYVWEQLQGRFDEDNTINECGKTDVWPVLAKSLSWGYGDSGTNGFGGASVKDRYHAGGHGQYFEPKFVETYWEPFIKRGKYEGTEFEGRMPKTPWSISVLGIMPLKSLLVVVSIALAVLGTQTIRQFICKTYNVIM